ncbi:MAG: hypothetical protein U9N60_05480 [Thermodesulfobacteriota bacterium]|nr:hypothetical protein [Thermodesulfobacteriota bacterium]
MRKKIILTGMLMAALVIGMAGMASAAPMTVEITGEVNVKVFKGTTPVKVGDTFARKTIQPFLRVKNKFLRILSIPYPPG